MMVFYLGTHEPRWLIRDGDAPFFLAYQRRDRFPLKGTAQRDWALDSGGFTELNKHGRWTLSAKDYAEFALTTSARLGRLQFAAIQDWMCEPFVIQKTGLSIEEHQRRTILSFKELHGIEPNIPWAPVLQGWSAEDYFRHVDMYYSSGLDLRQFPVVGIGSVCRRQATSEAERIVSSLFTEPRKWRHRV